MKAPKQAGQVRADMVARWCGTATIALLVAYDTAAAGTGLPNLPVAPRIDLFAVALVATVWGSIRRFERIIISPQRELWLHGLKRGLEMAHEDCDCPAQGKVVQLPLSLYASDLVPARPASHRPSPRRRHAN